MDQTHVVIVSNDVVPGSAMPVAAPGLRAFGLAEGLRAHGWTTEIVVVSSTVERQWRGVIPPPTQPGTKVLPETRLTEYLSTRRPVIAVITNSNQIDQIEKLPGISLVLDFFAPKMLELSYASDELDVKTLRELRERKIRAINTADAFIVNGAKKIPYFLAWILQTDRDLRECEIGVVPMAIPAGVVEVKKGPGLRLVNAGYLQGWSHHGRWVRVLEKVLDHADVELHVLTPPHWGQPKSTLLSTTIENLVAHPSVKTHRAMRFSDFQRFVAQADVSIDMFDWSWEREYAMVTRTVVALAAGVPVIHPPFTEVSPVIAEFDAGWLIDPEDEAGLEDTLTSLREDRDQLSSKADNAREAWRKVFEPRLATRALDGIVKRLHGR